MQIEAAIREIQTTLGITADGKPGPLTWEAIHKRICPSGIRWPVGVVNPAHVVTGGTVDPRSEKNIATLHPRVQPYARSFIQKAAAAGITIKIISGLRTYADQNALYTQGRTAPGAIVTNARGGYSNHNFGLAFDIGIFSGSKYLEESPLYAAVAPIALDLGLEWGGNWKTLQDLPHYQLRPAWAQSMTETSMLTELRRRKADGRDFFA
jgi:peptidoglycan L-alanyl-D-glutamate endopeptidase CwlK